MTIYPTTDRIPDFYIQARIWWDDEANDLVDDAPASAKIKLPISGQVVLALTYPLNSPFRTICAEPEGGWTFERLAHAVADSYDTVYRNHTNEIWGHVLGDLILEGYIHQNPDGSWTPAMGS